MISRTWIHLKTTISDNIKLTKTNNISLLSIFIDRQGNYSTNKRRVLLVYLAKRCTIIHIHPQPMLFKSLIILKSTIKAIIIHLVEFFRNISRKSKMGNIRYKALQICNIDILNSQIKLDYFGMITQIDNAKLLSIIQRGTT